jgi:hypothetical protein
VSIVGSVFVPSVTRVYQKVAALPLPAPWVTVAFCDPSVCWVAIVASDVLPVSCFAAVATLLSMLLSDVFR